MVAAGQSSKPPLSAKKPASIKLPAGFSVPKSTWSPNGHYGVLVPDEDHLRENVSQNAVIDLKTGAALGTIRAMTGHSGSNHGHINPSRWSSDSSRLLWEVDGKWHDRALVLVTIHNGKMASQLDVARIGEQAITARTTRVYIRKYGPAKNAKTGIGSANPGYSGGFINVQVEGKDGARISLPLKIHATLEPVPGYNPETDTSVFSEMDVLVSASGKVTITHFKMGD